MKGRRGVSPSLQQFGSLRAARSRTEQTPTLCHLFMGRTKNYCSFKTSLPKNDITCSSSEILSGTSKNKFKAPGQYNLLIPKMESKKSTFHHSINISLLFLKSTNFIKWTISLLITWPNKYNSFKGKLKIKLMYSYLEYSISQEVL